MNCVNVPFTWQETHEMGWFHTKKNDHWSHIPIYNITIPHIYDLQHPGTIWSMCFLSLWRPLRRPTYEVHPVHPLLICIQQAQHQRFHLGRHVAENAFRGQWFPGAGQLGNFMDFPAKLMEFNGILWWFNGILWWFNGILMGMTQAILRVASLIWVCQQVRNLAATCSHCFWSGKPVLKALWHPTFLNALTLLGSRGKTVSGAVQKCPWLSHRSRTNQSICPSPG